jgi:uncharacterized protein YdaU (DUF1376 family)
MKAPLPWMKYYVGDFEKMTAAMSVAERGAYQRLVDHYWSQGSITSNEAAICRITRTTPDEWLTLRDAVMAMFEFDHGEALWRCHYLDKLREEQRHEYKQQREAGLKGVEARRAKKLANGQGAAPHSPLSDP